VDEDKAAPAADGAGRLAGGSYNGPLALDPYQDNKVTCDLSNLPLWSYTVDTDDTGTADTLHLRVRDIKPGGTGALLDRTLALGVSSSGIDARVARDGRAWLVWSEYTGSTGVTYVATRAPGASGLAAAPTVLDASGADAQLFFDAAGNTHVFLQHPGATPSDPYTYGVRTAPLGSGSFGPEQPISVPANSYPQLLLGTPDGNPRLLLSASTGAPSYLNTYAIEGIPSAGSNEPLTQIGMTPSTYAAFTYLPSGDLLSIGAHTIDSDHAELYEGGLDTGSPPTLDNLAVPGLAAPNVPTPLSVDASDPLGLSSFSWTVDGHTLSDQHTSYVFPAAGSYVVKARAVDRAGNATELSRTIRVLDPAAVTPGTPEFNTAVLAVGGSLDRTPPSFTATATRGKTGKTAKSVAVTVKPNEVVAADVELIGSLKRGGQKGTLVLKSAHLAKISAGSSQTLSLAIPPSLAALVGNKLSARITLTDLAGNHAQKLVTVTRSKAKSKKK